MPNKPTCTPYLLSVLALFFAISALAQTRTAGQANAKLLAAAGTLPQSGNPLFLPAATYPFGTSFSVQAADVNGDGKLDLVVAELAPLNNAGSVGVFLNNGDGTFQPAVVYGTSPQLVTGLAVADVNGDGRPDLIVSGCSYVRTGPFCPPGSHGIVSVLLGNGDGTFQQAVAYNTGGAEASSAIVADVNGDGKPDILVTNSCQGGGCGYDVEAFDGGVAVLLGNGDGTFQPAAVYDSGGLGALSVAAADVNGDGKIDLLVANCGCNDGSFLNSGSVDVLLGNGDGTFQPPVGYSSGGSFPWSIAVADINGDSRPDLVVANDCLCGHDATVAVLLGNGDGTFQPAQTSDSGGQVAFSVAVADVNGDGKPDVVVLNRCADSNCNTHATIGVLLGNGDGTLEPVVTFDTGSRFSSSVIIADVNGDNRPDLLTADDGGLSVLINNTGPGSPTTTHPDAISFLRISRDGVLATATGVYTQNLLVIDEIAILRQQSGGHLGTPARRCKILRRTYLAGLPLLRHSAIRSETFASPTHMTVSAPPQ